MVEDNKATETQENAFETTATSEGANENNEATVGVSSDQDLDAMTPEQLKNKVVELQVQADDYMNRLQRLQADFENFRRRSRQEREEFLKFASEGLVCKMLPVIDNFERALSVQGDNANLQVGVEMIFRQLVETLAQEGLEVMDCKGQEFDPSCHQAVAMEPNDAVPDNCVIDEFQKGYRLKGKVLRPAMVKVAQN